MQISLSQCDTFSAKKRTEEVKGTTKHKLWRWDK